MTRSEGISPFRARRIVGDLDPSFHWEPFVEEYCQHGPIWISSDQEYSVIVCVLSTCD